MSREPARCRTGARTVFGRPSARSRASHLFEEKSTLEQAAILARDWFLTWLGRHPAGR